MSNTRRKTQRTSWSHPKEYDYTSEQFIGCERKKAFGSEGEARLAAVYSSEAATKSIRYYKCSFCKKFHLTSSTFIKEAQ